MRCAWVQSQTHPGLCEPSTSCLSGLGSLVHKGRCSAALTSLFNPSWGPDTLRPLVTQQAGSHSPCQMQSLGPSVWFPGPAESHPHACLVNTSPDPAAGAQKAHGLSEGSRATLPAPAAPQPMSLSTHFIPASFSHRLLFKISMTTSGLCCGRVEF